MLKLSVNSERGSVDGVDRIHQGELRIPEKWCDIHESIKEPPLSSEGMSCLEHSGEQYNKIRGMHGLSAPFRWEYDLKLQVDKPVNYIVSITSNNRKLG